MAAVKIAAAEEGLDGVDELPDKAFSVNAGVVGVVEHSRAETRVLGSLREDVFVVVGNAEVVGNGLADESSGAAIMAADGDDEGCVAVHRCDEVWEGHFVCSLR